MIVLFRKQYLPISVVSLPQSYIRDHPCSGSTVLLTCPLQISKPQYFLSLCRYVGHRNHKVLLFIELKQLLEPAVYLQQSFAIFCAAFLSQLQGSNRTELISLYVVLHLQVPKVEYFWKRHFGDWQGQSISHVTVVWWNDWICWDVWGQGNGFDGLLGLTLWGQDGGCNGCDGVLGLTVWERSGECNCCDSLLGLTMSGQEGGCDGTLEITVWGQSGGCSGFDGMLEITVRGQDGGCNCWDGLLGLKVWGQDGGCNCCDGLLRLTVWGQDGGCNGCDGLLELTVWNGG